MGAPHRLLLVVAASVPALLPSPVAAQWTYDGSNTLRYEHYRVGGDPAGSPWPFTGNQPYNEFGLNFQRRISDYQTLRGQFLGVINDSDYRSRHKGLVPERFSLVHENGDAAIPFRAEYGDTLAYFSYLTHQATQKGVLFDLQPQSARPDRQHSIILMAGETEPSWRDLEFGRDSVVGASWLVADPRIGNLGFNSVFSRRDDDDKLSLPERRQSVWSVAWQKPFRLGELDLEVETEAALFNGEHNGTLKTPSGKRRSDQGYFGELTGSHRIHPFGFRLRAEHYGHDYRPRGAVVTPDRRSYEMHGSWRTDAGMSLRGRWQRFRDDAESDNPRDTGTLGLSLSGNVLGRRMPDVVGTVNAYRQRVQSRDKLIDATHRVLNADLSKPLDSLWTGRFGLYYQDTADHSAAGLDQRIGQITLAGSRTFRFAGFTGMFSPGVQYRRLRGAERRHEWNPTLSVIGRRGPHLLNFSYGYFSQQMAAGDTLTQSLRMGYRYASGAHTFGVDVDLFDRKRKAALDTDAQVLRLFWTYSFDSRPPARSRPAAFAIAAPAQVTADVLALVPGLEFNRAVSALTREGVTNVARFGPYLVSEYAMLPKIDQRQRLVLTGEAGTLDGSALIIEFEDIGDAQSAQQTYLRVRRALIERYGTPTRVYEKGEFGASPVSDINSQQVVRIIEWDTDHGVLRFGIPQRYDGRLRMELQHAARFPDLRDGFWSIDEVR